MDAKVKEALEAVIKECPDTGYGGYAKTYAQAALCNTTQVSYVGKLYDRRYEMEGEELRVQILYVLNNLAYWKGERAREIKTVLRTASK